MRVCLSRVVVSLVIASWQPTLAALATAANHCHGKCSDDAAECTDAEEHSKVPARFNPVGPVSLPIPNAKKCHSRCNAAKDSSDDKTNLSSAAHPPSVDLGTPKLARRCSRL